MPKNYLEETFDPTDFQETQKEVKIRGLLPSDCWKNENFKSFLAQLCVPSFGLSIYWCGEHKVRKSNVSADKYLYDLDDFDYFLHFEISGNQKLSNKYLSELLDAIRSAGGVITKASYNRFRNYNEVVVVDIVPYETVFKEAEKVALYCQISVIQSAEISQGAAQAQKVIKELFNRWSVHTLIDWFVGQGHSEFQLLS